MVDVVVIGAGRIGAIHARALARNPAARLAGIADPRAEAAHALAEEVGAPVLDPDTAIERAGDGVVIASSTDTHVPLMERAAAAGKAIFCEKPIDLDLARVDACLEKVARAGVTLMMGFNRRFDTSFAQLKARLEAGEVGPAELIQITSRDPEPPPAHIIPISGGLFRDMMIHDLDMARWLVGQEPVTVQATGSCRVASAFAEAGDVDTAAVLLTTPDGTVISITNSRRAVYGYDQRVEVLGPQGMLHLGNRLENQVEAATSHGMCRARAEHFFLERYAEAYTAETAHFVATLQAGARPIPDGHDGRQALALADAATEAWQTGQTVTVSPPPSGC